MFLKPLCIQDKAVWCWEMEKLSLLSRHCMDEALLVKTAEKPANRILTTLFRLQTGFREKATTAELQT